MTRPPSTAPPRRGSWAAGLRLHRRSRTPSGLPVTVAQPRAASRWWRSGWCSSPGRRGFPGQGGPGRLHRAAPAPGHRGAGRARARRGRGVRGRLARALRRRGPAGGRPHHALRAPPVRCSRCSRELVREPTFPEEEVRTERRAELGQFANDMDDPVAARRPRAHPHRLGGTPLRPRRDGNTDLGRRASAARTPSTSTRPTSGHVPRSSSSSARWIPRRRSPRSRRPSIPGRTGHEAGVEFCRPRASPAPGRWWWSTGRSRPRARSASPARRTAAARRCSSPPRW